MPEEIVETEVEETEEVAEETDAEGTAPEVEEEVEETYTQKDLDKVKGALEKERTLNKDKTAEIKAKNAEIRELKLELKKSLESKLEDDSVKATLADAEKRAVKYRDIAVNKEAKLALVEAGAKVSTARLIKLLDLADCELDDNGKVSGLEDAIAELKEESPEFFKSEEDEEKPVKKVTVRKPGPVDGGNKTAVTPKKLSSSEQFAAMLKKR